MAEKVLMKGNEALAESALRAGCRFFFGYPITPQTELAAYMSKRMEKVGGTFLQAESEIAAINMVYGAAAAGARVMTVVLVAGHLAQGRGHLLHGRRRSARRHHQRAARRARASAASSRRRPTTGRPRARSATATSAWWCTRRPLSRRWPTTCTRPSTWPIKYRMPAMILADGMLGQMMEPVVMPEPIDSLPEKPWATNGHKHRRPAQRGELAVPHRRGPGGPQRGALRALRRHRSATSSAPSRS